MKIIIAPDSFKDALSAIEAAKTIFEGFNEVKNNHDYFIAPISDGGEGLLSILTSDVEEVEVKGPLGDLIIAQIGFIDNKKTVVIEMALAAGLEKVEKEKRNPMNTTSYGVGQLLLKALEYNPDKIILGLGGSATNDLGIGALQALGIKFYDDKNNEVGIFGRDLLKVEKVEISNINKHLAKVNLIIASDVKNPLLGDNGATNVYGLQKGLKENYLSKFNYQFEKVSKLLNKEFKKDLTKVEGSGAAGGLAYAFGTAFNGKITSGFDVVYEELKLKTLLKEADILITGEGKTDNQTLSGKAPYMVAREAKKINPKIKVYSFVGTNLLKTKNVFDEIIEINNPKFTLNENILETKNNLKQNAILFAKKTL